MRNIKVQVKSFDLIPRLLPELHRKSVRRRKLQVGFNGFPARKKTSQATRKGEEGAGCLLRSSRRPIDDRSLPETRAVVDAHTDRSSSRTDAPKKKKKKKRVAEDGDSMKKMVRDRGGSVDFQMQRKEEVQG